MQLLSAATMRRTMHCSLRATSDEECGSTAVADNDEGEEEVVVVVVVVVESDPELWLELVRSEFVGGTGASA